MATGSCDQSIKLWETFSGKCLGTLSEHTGKHRDYQITEILGWINCLEWEQQTNRLFSGSYDKVLKMWDPEKLRKIRSFRGHKVHLFMQLY